ncbi:MAG: BLUF domain-containing protein [Pseudomonadota bacterium]
MPLQEVQLVYASQPFGYDALSLTGILLQARQSNKKNGITGALICRDDLFLQMLEGPPDKVTETFARIERDERHVNVTRLFYRDIDHRIFPEWSMRHDPVQSWMWTPEQVAQGAVQEAQMGEIVDIFERLAKQPAQGL